MRVIGIDPGTLHVGFGVVEEREGRLVRLDSGSISCSGDTALPERLCAIHRALQTVIREWRPEVAAVETIFFGENIKTAIKIGEGRGVALLSCAEAEVKVVGYEPALVKRAVCGSGRAGKEQVSRMVRVLLALDKEPATDHESDALALALCHLNRARTGLAGAEHGALPEAVLKALGGKIPPRRKASRKGAGRIRLR